MSALNLADRLISSLDAATVALLRQGGEEASRHGDAAYLVGGAVRDLILDRSILDIDIVVDGDAYSLVESLSDIETTLSARSRFLTYKSTWQGIVIDIATARRETYAQPGALPMVKQATIDEDLGRRDFTINVLALSLAPGEFGDVMDVRGGLDDLRDGMIRILHDHSFEDDATRLWRAVRYETRLDFRMSAETEAAARRDVRFLETISADRLRHEIERVWQEPEPARVMARASELGLVQAVVPPIPWDEGLSSAFAAAKKSEGPGVVPPLVYVALHGARLDSNTANRLAVRLNLPREEARAVEGAARLRDEIESLLESARLPSQFVAALDALPISAVQAHALLSDGTVLGKRLSRYLNEWRHIRPALTGTNLLEMGVQQGPQIGEMLRALCVLCLDRGISEDEERRLVRRWVETPQARG